MTTCSRSRTTRAAAAATLGLALAAGASTASAGGFGYAQDDPSGDVRITAKEGLSETKRQSIDTLYLSVRDEQVGRTVEFLVQLRDITGAKGFDQVVTFSMNRPGEAELAGVTFSPSPGDRRDGSAVRRTEDGTKTCSGITTQVVDEERLAFVSVPYRCVPDEPVEISLVTSTGTFRGDGPTFSRDRTVSNGTVQLRPGAPQA